MKISILTKIKIFVLFYSVSHTVLYMLKKVFRVIGTIIKFY